MQSEPRSARTPVWALSISLAATLEIEVSFFSSGYLDVSVPPVPFHTLWIGVWILEVCSSGFPHSDISGSMDICSSPKLFAAYHVLHRLSVPRHPPCALNAWPVKKSAAIIALMTGFCVLCFKSNWFNNLSIISGLITSHALTHDASDVFSYL